MISDILVKEIVNAVLDAAEKDIMNNRNTYDRIVKQTVHDYEELHKVVVVENETH